jgi:hypothetical protein
MLPRVSIVKTCEPGHGKCSCDAIGGGGKIENNNAKVSSLYVEIIFLRVYILSCFV